MRGKFIVLEGPDRCGKSTQAKMLYNQLVARGKEVILTREPGGTPTAEKIRQIVLEPGLDVRPMAELLLYEASRAQHTQEKILPALEAGKIVICERYTMSTCAYQGYGRGIDLKIIDTLNKIATLGTVPDLTLVFLMSDKYFTQRGEYLFSDRLEQEDISFRQKMRKGYLEMIERTPHAYLLDADKNIEEIQARVLQLLREHHITA
ncbi:MAG: dTMP kinase [Elusimicrobia bacterium]|nr:dTMP kinase [Elusimicrobiota bacterium]MDD7502417.1 dTMP kinase [Elusimicrobiota bacterium]MDY5728917.1 dTMP kinase [Elusimicrobiaceae bacterium]